MITRCLNLLLSLLTLSCGYGLAQGNAEPERMPISRHEIINLTTELALTETAYRRLVVALPTSDLNPGATLRVVIRSRTPGLVAVDQAGLAGAGLVQLSLQFEWVVAGRVKWSVNSDGLSRGAVLARTAMEGRVARENAYQSALRDGLDFGIERFKAFIGSQRGNQSK
ncbi:MAG: hypothetical protein ACON3Z_11990 [Bradymonadia bacterium]